MITASAHPGELSRRAFMAAATLCGAVVPLGGDSSRPNRFAFMFFRSLCNGCRMRMRPVYWRKSVSAVWASVCAWGACRARESGGRPSPRCGRRAQSEIESGNDHHLYFQIVRELNVTGPMSVHFEYPPLERFQQSVTDAEKRRLFAVAMHKNLSALNGYLTNYHIA